MLNPTLSQSTSGRPSGFSRRDLLKGFTVALSGAPISPFFAQQASGKPVQPHLSSTPAILLEGVLSSGNQVTASGLASYGPGWIFVLTENESGSGTTYDLEFVDVHSLNTIFSFVTFYNRALPSTPFVQPVSDDTYVYTASGNTAYVIPLADPMTYAFSFSTGANVIANLSLTGQLLLIGTDDGRLTAYNVQTRAAQWSVSAPGLNSFAVDGGTVYASANGQLLAYNLDDGSTLFSAAAVIGQVTASDDSVFITSSSGVYSYSVANSGSPNWSYLFTGPGTRPAALYSAFLYVLDSAGSLHEIQAGPTQGNANRPPLTFGPDVDPTQALVFEDGVVYGASAGGASNLTIYPMVLASGATSAYPTNVPGRFLGVENGTCFFTHNSGGSVAGVALNPQVNGFFAESELMADDYPGGSVKAQGTSFRTHVRLQDANSNPRVNKALKIWANEPVTLVIESTTPGGQPTQVNLTGGLESAYWSTTDGSGEISIICVASNVTCPAIYMWGSFMYQVNGEYMVLYPDQNTINQLSTKTASDLSNATAYDNTSLLQDQYKGSADIIATHIQNTLGGVAAVSLARGDSGWRSVRTDAAGHRRPPALEVDPNKYLAYPGSSPNLSSRSNYSQNVANTYRAFSPAKIAYCANLGLACSSSEVLNEELLGSFLGDFKSLVKNVVTAAKDVAQKVVQVVVTVVNNVVQHVVQVAEGFYKFAVNTIEAAAASVAAVLATVAKDISSAVQWLSYLFDWSDMVANANTLSSSVANRLQNFVTWIGSEVTNVDSYVDQIFGNITSDITQAFSTIIGDIGGSTLQSHQPNGNNPQQIYGANGASSYTKTQWMNSKVKNNANGSSASSVPLRKKVAEDPAVSNLLQAGESFLQTLKSKLGTDFPNLPGNLHGEFVNSGSLMGDPGAFVTNTITILLTLLEDAAVLALDFVKDVFEAFVETLSDLINGAISLMTETIEIPVISELWSVITSSQPSFNLSFLNLISLLLAIPSTIILKAFNGTQNRVEDSNLGSFGEDLLKTGLVIAGMIYAGFDAFSDVSNQNADSGVALVAIGLTAVTFGLSFPQPLPNDDAAIFVWYVASALPLVYASYMYAANKYKFGSFALANSQNGSTNGLFGFAMIGASGLLCSKDPTDFKGENYLTLLQNLFTYLPYFGKAFAQGEAASPPRIGVGIVDAVGDVTGTILGVVPH